MALTSTLYQISVDLSDVDRGVYETVSLRVACHPSEHVERLVLRTFARLLSHEEDLAFGRGLSHAEDPALQVLAPHGQIALWIDVGAPSAERLHRASKAAERVQVYTDKDLAALRQAWSARAIHRADALEVIRVPQELTTTVAGRMRRKVHWSVTRNDNELLVSIDDELAMGELVSTTVDALLAEA